MSPRDSFWFLAGVLVAVAIMVTVRAWLRERPALGEATARRPTIPSFAVPLAAGLALVGVALGIYFLLGSPDAIAPGHASAASQPSHDTQMGQQPSATAGSLDNVTNKLAARLAAQGGSDNDWQLLAESYEYMGRAAEAKAARAHVTSAAPMVAATGDSTPGQVSGDQIADIADALDEPHAVPVANTTTGQTANGASPDGRAAISGTVEITAKLARQAKSGATLFIYAKQPDTPGPPLAVLRLRAEHWPVMFTLNDGNSMVPGRNLSNANTVQIEARISKNGDALPQSGDLVGSVTSVNPRDGHPVKISIDREIG
jgi:hypothetical protein